MSSPSLAETEAFVAVVRCGGFRAAAAELGVTASAVSKRVAALEARLAARLLHRTTRRVAATEIGEAFYERARAALVDLAEAEAAVSESQGVARGRIRLGSPVDFGRRYLVEPLAAFAAEYAEVELDVSFSDRFVDVVGEGFDVVLRIGDLPDSALVARPLAPCRRLLVASPDYLARRGRPRSAADLADHELLVYALDQRRSLHVDGRAMPIRGRHVADNGAMLAGLARAGLGLALLPTFLCGDDLRTGALEAVLPGQVSADLTLHAVTPHRQLLSTRVRLLIERLRDAFGAEPPWDAGLDVIG
jgi:DNA-binding transcriptional LysR family regulator